MFFFGLLSFFIVAVDYAHVCSMFLFSFLLLLLLLQHAGWIGAHHNAIAVDPTAFVVVVLF